MGKNKASKFKVKINGKEIPVDSQEEVDFYHWLEEAKDLGIIRSYKYQPKSFTLFNSTKYTSLNGKSKTLFREHIYTPDFLVEFDITKCKKLVEEFKIDKSIYDSYRILNQYIDVKGTFAKNDGGRSFSINQKWVYDKYNIYIYKLIPKEFFKKFGVPEKCKLTEKTKKPRKMFDGCKSIKDICQ